MNEMKLDDKPSTDETTLDKVGLGLDKVGLGLSRLLRYSYGGFLFVLLASIADATRTGAIITAMTWQVTCLAAIVVGTAIYSIHRSMVVPIHHALFCMIWQRPANPVYWLHKSLGVDWKWCIPSYTALRQGNLFTEKEKSNWNVAHAETGTVLMTAEAFVAAFVVQSCSEINFHVSDASLLILGSLFLVFSLGGFAQHAIECRRFKEVEKAGLISAELSKLGFLTEPQQSARTSRGSGG